MFTHIFYAKLDMHTSLQLSLQPSSAPVYEHLQLTLFCLNRKLCAILQDFIANEVFAFLKPAALVGKMRPFLSVLLTSQEPLPKDSPSVTTDACQTTLNATYYPWCLES